MWHMFVVLVTIIIFRQYKSKLSDHAQDILQLTGFPIQCKDFQLVVGGPIIFLPGPEPTILGPVCEPQNSLHFEMHTIFCLLYHSNTTLRSSSPQPIHNIKRVNADLGKHLNVLQAAEATSVIVIGVVLYVLVLPLNLIATQNRTWSLYPSPQHQQPIWTLSTACL